MKQALTYIVALLLSLPVSAQSIATEGCQKDDEVIFTRECISKMLGEEQPPLANLPQTTQPAKQELIENESPKQKAMALPPMETNPENHEVPIQPPAEGRPLQTTNAWSASKQTIANPAQSKAQCTSRNFITALAADDKSAIASCRLTPELANSVDTTPEYRGRTALHWAVLTSNTEMLQQLLQADADPDHPSPTDLNASPLHLAVMQRNLQSVQLLINANAKINNRNLLKEAPLHLAVREGEVEIAEALMSAGADIEARDRTGKTPLLTASLGSSEEVIGLLLQSGANLYAKSRQGNTALHYSVLISSATTQLLIKAGAQLDVTNSQGATPLQRLSDSMLPQHENTLKMLIDQASPLEKRKLSEELLRSALNKNEISVFTRLLSNGFSPAELSLADLQGKPAFIRALQKNGWLQ